MTGLDVLLAVGLTARLTRLLIDDKILDPARKAIWGRRSAGKGVGYLLTCPWCASVWVGAVVVALVHVPGWEYPALVGTASYVTGWLARWAE